MGGFRHEQQRLSHRGREFHFVSYEATEANAARHQAALPDFWYLISSGNRWPAIPHVPEQPAEELKMLLVAWLEAEVFSGRGPVPRPMPDQRARRA